MHPGRGRPSGRPAAALGARASRPQSRRFRRLTPFRHRARRGLLRFRRVRRGGRGHASNPKPKPKPKPEPKPKPKPKPKPNRDPNPNPNHLQDEEDFYDDVDEMGYDDFDEDGEDWGDDDDEMLYSSS